MFYYRIVATSRETKQVYHREALYARDVGDFVAQLLGRSAKKITVARISQAAYVRATRPGQ